jgi:rubrerythrin
MTALDALQTALAAEHAAVYLYGVLAGRTAPGVTPELADNLAAAYREHRDRRDELAAMVREVGSEPVAAAPVYDVPLPLDTPGAQRGAAVDAEQAATQTYAALVADTVGDTRSWGIAALTAAAIREVSFGARARRFPGAPELAG